MVLSKVVFINLLCYQIMCRHILYNHILRCFPKSEKKIENVLFDINNMQDKKLIKPTIVQYSGLWNFVKNPRWGKVISETQVMQSELDGHRINTVIGMILMHFQTFDSEADGPIWRLGLDYLCGKVNGPVNRSGRSTVDHRKFWLKPINEMHVQKRTVQCDISDRVAVQSITVCLTYWTDVELLIDS